MKDIKFRAFCKKKKKVYQVTSIRLDGAYHGPRVISYMETQNMIQDVELMQFTGLKDKYGVDIYENDILQRDEYNDMGVVIFADSRSKYVLEWINYKPSSYPQHLDINQYRTSNAEIIGNIYENPELLLHKPE